MSRLISKSVLATVVLAAFAYGCKKNVQEEHSILDQQDAPVMAKLQTEIQNTQSHNQLLILYDDSLNSCTDSAMMSHYNDMMGNGGMMNGGGMMGGNGSYSGDGHDCSMMEDIKDYCGTMDEMEQEHEKYCPQKHEDH